MNIPKLRFKEFTDEWQIKKLDKNTYIKARVGWKNLKASEYVSSGIPMIAGQHIKQGKILWDKVDFITNERYDESPEIQLKNNDIIFSKDGSLGNPAIIKNMPKKATINGTMMLIRLNYINDNVSPNYFYQICNSQYFKKMVSLIKSGGTVPHIFQRDIINFTFPIPKTLEEQEKIANFLSIVDKKVENLKNTITSLENQKKGLLQQIFSQKLRFKDKNGNNYPNWEKKKLGDIGSFSRGGNLSKSDLSKKGTSCILYGELYTYYNEFATEIKSKTLNTTNLVLSKKYDVLLPLSGETAEDISTCTCIFFDDIALGSDLLIFRSSFFDGRFMSLLLKYKYKYKIAQIAQGKSIVHISEKNIKNINIKIPCIEEQQNIADFILIFTKKLENQKAQLEHWKQIKKGLLQQMFV